MDIRFDIRVPIYIQLAQLIKERIETGVYKPGSQIPPETALCETYQISRVTVRKAITLLTDEGILVKQQGKGTFVAMSMVVESSKAQGSFTLSCQQNGVVPSTKIISCGVTAADAKLAADLNVAENSDIVCIKRVRCANEVPVIFETDYLPLPVHQYLLSANLENDSLLDTIRSNTGLDGTTYEDIFDVRFATEEQMAHLGCKKGAALLGVYQKVFSKDGSILYTNEQYICSEHYKYKSVHKK